MYIENTSNFKVKMDVKKSYEIIIFQSFKKNLK